jgi:putative nucleotidyltransferase with HDIG domain
MSIAAMGAMVETRDPYTAGHQERTARLARRIAVEMGLDSDQIKTVYYGSLLHDIGKLFVPGDILTKPGKLNTSEFELIKQHPVYGENILKPLKFPWPLWKLAAQHHERMDGSGYPKGLAGEDIDMETRILAVADTVEAMASHRPYRPSLGIDAALKEIASGKGSLYDEDVVDTCISLFRDKGFEFDRSPKEMPYVQE